MDDFPWYRFYNETLSDKKIKRICRDTGQCKALVIGTWATILALASESPQRGLLLISNDIELTADEIRDETGLDAATFDALIAGFIRYDMLMIIDGCWEIRNWHKRQFNSDNSTERVRRHRQKAAVTETVKANDVETLQKRFGNVIDTDTDADTDTDTDAEGERGAAAPAPAPPPATSPDFQDIPPDVKRQKRRARVDELLEPSPVPDVYANAPPVMTLLHRLTGFWPGENKRDELIAQLGEQPDEPTLTRAVTLWDLAGHKLNNFLGISDWYQELLRDPDWTPGKRFKSNGRGPGSSSAAPPAAPPLSRSEEAAAVYATAKRAVLGGSQP